MSNDVATVAGWSAGMTYCRTPSSDYAVSVVLKRNYAIQTSGEFVRAEEQEPLRLVGEFDDDVHPVRYLRGDVEFFPFKERTDLVVHGQAWAHGGASSSSLVVVKIGDLVKRVAVVGDRDVELGRGGEIRFSRPAPFESLPLTWRRCYGGIDVSIPREEPATVLDLLEQLEPESHPGAYPRNPAGTGYAVSFDPQYLRGLSLPNFEDPNNLLQPENLVLAHEHWSARPQPQGLGWVAPGWYPRSVFCGILPEAPPYDDDPSMFEVKERWMPLSHSRMVASNPEGDNFHFRFCNGAASGMRFAGLRGDEEIRTWGLCPHGERNYRLPREIPRVEIGLLGDALRSRVTLQTIEIDVAQNRAVLVWSAIAETHRALPVSLPRGRDAYDPFLGVVASVDGAILEHDDCLIPGETSDA